MNGEVYFELITPTPEVDDPELTRPLIPLQERVGKVLLEDAKLLSINSRFQDDVRRLREQWHVSVPDDTPTSFDLDDAVRSYWQELNVQEVSELKHAMRNLMARFGLDPLRHWGLVLGAVFYGITFTNVRDHWDKIESLATRGAPRLLQTDDLMLPDRERLAHLAIIKWLWLYTTQKDRSLKFPAPVGRIIEEAVFMENGPEVWGDLEKLAEFIERTLAGEPVPALLIPVDEFTTMNDLERVWPLVEQCKTVFLDGAKRERRVWTEYARDVELMILVDEYGDYDDAIREYHRRHPGERLIVDGHLTYDVRDLARQAVHRARERSV